jgi:hypothetical protein
MVLNFTDGYDVSCWLTRKINTKYFKEVSHSVTVFCNQLPTFYERILYTYNTMWIVAAALWLCMFEQGTINLTGPNHYSHSANR